MKLFTRKLTLAILLTIAPLNVAIELHGMLEQSDEHLFAKTSYDLIKNLKQEKISPKQIRDTLNNLVNDQTTKILTPYLCVKFFLEIKTMPPSKYCTEAIGEVLSFLDEHLLSVLSDLTDSRITIISCSQ
ncbi:MAG: hypothetical protein ABH827_02335 [bacterium]